MASKSSYECFDINLGTKVYPVIVGDNLLQNSIFLQEHLASEHIVVVTNSTVAPLYLQQLNSSLEGRCVQSIIIPDGEQYKNSTQLSYIYDQLISFRCHRDAMLVALGGGVIGDMTGFAASTYLRGIRFVQIPTTLLAQVDASVGGKTGINHAEGKNLIGSFYQPDAVLIDVHTLKTLPEREFRAGLAEVIKYALLQGGAFYDELKMLLESGIDASTPKLPGLITTSCRIKAEYVQSDEREHASRALLNLGHTFAHALETYTNYETWLHGEAVAIGLYCAAILSVRLGHGDSTLISDLKKMLQAAGLPFKIPGTINLDRLADLMQLDKKIKNNQLRFVVIKEPGVCYLNDSVSAECLQHTLTMAVKGE